ncbi:MAG: hypothetical protein ACLPZF_25055, partial [Candidatus Acidiferrales bacterium]
VARNKRYLIWFWLLNLTLAEFGASAFRRSAHAMLDHSLAAGSLLHGFDLATFTELLGNPQFGYLPSMSTPAIFFSFVFFLATALFLPGVFEGYASSSRLPREDFFRACGRNLWRFIRLMIISGIVMSIVAGVLFAIQAPLLKKVAESTNELLPFRMRILSMTIIFLVMTILRMWFDLAEVDVVLNDQRAVRKSIWTALRHTLRSIFRLLAGYVVATILAAIFLVGGLCFWVKFVGPESVLGAYLAAQLILFVLLIPRFWQRGIAVSYWQQKMMAPAVAVEPTPAPIFVQPITPTIPEPPPIVPDIPPQTLES